MDNSSTVTYSDLPAGFKPLPQAAQYSDLPAGFKPVESRPDFAKQPESHWYTGVGDTLGREASAVGSSIAGIPGALYHGFADPETGEEKSERESREAAGGIQPNDPISRGLNRLVAQPIATAGKWYGDAARGKIPNAYEQALSVAPEAMGAGGAAVLVPKLGETIGKIPGAAVDAAPNLPAKVKAFGKLGVQEAVSHVPAAGRLVRRPSYGDWWDALKAKAPVARGEVLPPSTDQIPGRPYAPNPRYQAPMQPIPARQGMMLPPGPAAPRVPLWKSVQSEGTEVPSIVNRQPYAQPARAPRTPATAPAPRVPLIERMGGKPVETITGGKTSWPPEAPEVFPRQKGVVPGSPEDIQGTRGIQEQVRDAAEGEDRSRLSQVKREWFARNQPRMTKGELTGQPAAPVKFSKTPGVRLADKVRQVPGPNEDLTPLLRKSLKEAMRKKGD
jgi:hypothetical protein